MTPRAAPFKCLTLKLIHSGQSLEEVSIFTGISLPTLYEWIEDWNKKKEGGIINQQGKGGGAKSKLSAEQKATLKVELGTKDFWTLGEIDQLVQDKFVVNYSQRHLRTILKEMDVFHYKPEPLDYHRSYKSEQELTDKLLATTDALQLLGLNIDEIAFGFADEACPQANSNTARMWSINRKTRRVNTQKLSCKTFGFYA